MGDENQAPLQPGWTRDLDSREWSQVLHAIVYARDHIGAGAPGHGQFLLIAKLVKLLDEATDVAVYAQGRPVIRKVVRDDQGVWRDVNTGVKVEVP